MKKVKQFKKLNTLASSSKAIDSLKISTENLLLFLNLNMLEKYCKQTFELYSSAMGVKKWSLFILLIAFSFCGFSQNSKIEKT